MSVRAIPRRLFFGVILLFTALVGFVVAAVVDFVQGPVEWGRDQVLSPPSHDHWLGSALYGQPVSELLISGAQTVFVFGAVSVLISVIVALVLGFLLASSVPESPQHRFFSYFLDVFGAVPGFLIALAVLYALGSSPWALVVAFSVANWDSSTRLAWSVGRLVVSRPAYLADQSLGYDGVRLFWFHYLPEVFGPLSAKFCSLMAFFIVFGASMVVIGVLDPQVFAWGALINQGRHYFDIAPHVFLIGWLLIFGATFLLTMISSGIHLLFDRKLTR
jgi:ABC-type dipeptide/oligopeptide/nickel transport system permease subunit